MPIFYTKYKTRPPVGFKCESESKVQQQFRDQCATDAIIKKYNMMGVNPFISAAEPQYLDTTQVPSFVAAMDSQIRVKSYFENLPSDVRLQFNNSPEQFSQIVLSGEHNDMLRDLGILPPLPEDSTASETGKNPQNNKGGATDSVATPPKNEVSEENQ